MLEGLTVAYAVAVALAAYGSFRVYDRKLYKLFTCNTIRMQAWAGGLFQVLLFVIGSIVLWHSDYRKTAPHEVKLYIGALIAYYCTWFIFVLFANPKPRPLSQTYEQLLGDIPMQPMSNDNNNSSESSSSGEGDSKNRPYDILAWITLPVVAWCASQVTALVAIILIGDKFDKVPTHYYFVLVSQISYTTYTLSWDGYVYLHNVLLRESTTVKIEYAKICRNVVLALAISNIALHLSLRYTYYTKPRIADCDNKQWQCPSYQPTSINAKAAEYYATHGHNYLRAATASHFLNFTTAGLYFVGFAIKYRTKSWLIAATYATCVVTAMFVGLTAKILTQRVRPAVHYNLTNVTELRHKSVNDHYNSFFSADAAIAFAAASYVALHLLTLKRDTKHIIVSLIVVIVAGIGSWLRIVAMMHYVADVATGAGVGLLMALVFSGSALQLH